MRGVGLTIFLSLFLVLEGAPDALAGRPRRDRSRPLPVRVQEVALGRIGRSVRATGTLFAQTEVRLMSQAEGQVVEVLVREGDHVLRGQILARLDATVQRIELALAESELAAARARLAKLRAGNLPQEIAAAEAEVAQARASLRRGEAERTSAEARLKEAETNAKSLESLHRTGVISNQEWLKVSTEANRARAELAERKARLSEDTARVRAAGERLKLARLGSRPEDVAAAKAEEDKRLQQVRLLWVQLEYFTVRAPISAVVTDRRVEPGDLALNRSHLFSLAHVKTLKVRGQVSELELSQIRVGQDVVVEFDAYPGRRFKGKVTRIFPQVDPHSRQAVVEAEIPNPDLSLRPGFHARMTFAPRLGREVLILPTHAVEWDENERGAGFVYVLAPAPARKRKSARTEAAGSGEPAGPGVASAEERRPDDPAVRKKRKRVRRFAASRKRVRLGQNVDGKVEILGGIEAGERVIVTSVDQLREGQLVRVVAE